ncbi:MAG: hypothetical protein R8K54_02480 [Mariprofundaceae bacterium]
MPSLVQSIPCREEVRNEQGGVKCRLIGVVLIALGFLDSLLTLRGGFPNKIYLILIATGVAVFAIGAVLKRRDGFREIDHES